MTDTRTALIPILHDILDIRMAETLSEVRTLAMNLDQRISKMIDKAVTPKNTVIDFEFAGASAIRYKVMVRRVGTVCKAIQYAIIGTDDYKCIRHDFEGSLCATNDDERAIIDYVNVAC